MYELLAGLGLIAAYLLVRLGEWRTHRFNYGFLQFAGADERIPVLMKIYYFGGLLLVILAYAESSFLNNKIAFNVSVMGIGLMIFGTMLRFWAMNSLGRVWSMRCMYIPGIPTVKHGPYRLLKHPEYFSRLVEGLGLCLFFGSIYSGSFYLLFCLVLNWKMVGEEKKQILELATERH